MANPNASHSRMDEVSVERLFMRMHGYFGNAFLDKFRLGEGAEGKDSGIENAKRVWLAELREFTPQEVAGAIKKLRDAGSTFPPSLPEFVAACRACRRPKAFDPDKALPAPQAGKVLQRLIAQRDRQSLAMKPAGGLATLLSVTALAVATAGGDEVATLKRLESEVFRSPQP